MNLVSGDDMIYLLFEELPLLFHIIKLQSNLN